MTSSTKDIALAMIAPPMKILTGRRGQVMTDREVALICDRKHCHMYSFDEIVERGAECKTCTAGTKKVRDMMKMVETITQVPWVFAEEKYTTPCKKHTLEVALCGESRHKKTSGGTHTVLVLTSSAKKVEAALGALKPSKPAPTKYIKTPIVYSAAFAERVVESSHIPAIAQNLICVAKKTS